LRVKDSDQCNMLGKESRRSRGND